MYGARTGVAVAVHSALTFIGGWSSPADLFAQGEQGAWYDPQDYGTSGTDGVGTLYQDSAGQTAVTAVEQPVGLMLDKRKSKYATTGSELVTNGSFATDTDWTKAAGVTISGGVANFSAVSSSSALYQNLTGIAVGNSYVVTYTVTISAGTMQTQINGNTAAPSRSVSGTYTDILHVPAATNKNFIFVVNAFTGTIDNVSVKKLDGNHAYQSTSAARPTLRARYNVITYSEDVTNAAWAKVATATTPTATTASFPAANDYIYQTLTAATYAAKSVTISVELSGSGTTTVGFYDNVSGFQVDTITLTATPTRYTATKTIGTGAADVRLVPAGRATAGTATSVTVTKIDVRMSNLIGTGLPAYQRIAASTDYDTVGFPAYIQGNGSSQFMQTAAIDFSATDKMTVWSAVRKLSEAATAALMELSTNYNVNAGSFLISAPSSAASDYGFALRGSTGVISRAATTFAAPVSNVLTAQYDIAGADYQTEILARVNGSVPTLSGSGASGAGNFGSAYPLYLLSRAGSSLWFGGYFFGAIIRGAASNEAQIRLGERYLQQRSLAY